MIQHWDVYAYNRMGYKTLVALMGSLSYPLLKRDIYSYFNVRVINYGDEYFALLKAQWRRI